MAQLMTTPPVGDVAELVGQLDAELPYISDGVKFEREVQAKIAGLRYTSVAMFSEVDTQIARVCNFVVNDLRPLRHGTVRDWLSFSQRGC